MKKYFATILLLFLFSFACNANASCDIQPIAESYFKEITNYSTFSLPIPKLAISNEPLVKIEKEKMKEYGKHTSKSKGVMASNFNTDTSTITLYAQVFADHQKCDAFVYGKIKRYLIHEYTHYLDMHYPLSEMVQANNLETTAIMGENILPKLIWGRRNPLVIRSLTKKEQKHAKVLRRFFVKNKAG